MFLTALSVTVTCGRDCRLALSQHFLICTLLSEVISYLDYCAFELFSLRIRNAVLEAVSKRGQFSERHLFFLSQVLGYICCALLSSLFLSHCRYVREKLQKEDKIIAFFACGSVCVSVRWVGWRGGYWQRHRNFLKKGGGQGSSLVGQG